MSNISRTIEIPIKIGNAERVYTVNFPRVGQYIQVEARKAQLTIPKGLQFDQSTQYLNMIRQGTIASGQALDMVDMIAWFEVCIPDLMKNTVGELTSLEDLDIFDAKPLLDVYQSTFKPWRDAWEKLFQGITDEPKAAVEKPEEPASK